MRYLIDTNILLRSANPSDADHLTARGATERLAARGAALLLAPQNLVEFRAVATRPKNVNGLGMSPREAETASDGFEALFTLLDETPAIHPAWKALVRAFSVIGKQVHDARLAAACQVHGVPNILTFNTQHFARFAAAAPPVLAVDPRIV